MSLSMSQAIFVYVNRLTDIRSRPRDSVVVCSRQCGQEAAWYGWMHSRTWSVTRVDQAVTASDAGHCYLVWESADECTDRQTQAQHADDCVGRPTSQDSQGLQQITEWRRSRQEWDFATDGTDWRQEDFSRACLAPRTQNSQHECTGSSDLKELCLSHFDGQNERKHQLKSVSDNKM